VVDRLRLAVVGGGEVLERYHIPAINAVPEVVRSVVVDVNAERARRIADRYGFPISSVDLGDVVRHADIAVVLVPNGLHAPISCELLAQGIHVLCETNIEQGIDWQDCESSGRRRKPQRLAAIGGIFRPDHVGRRGAA